MTKRITISVDDEAAVRLVELAGGERKRGEFVSTVVHAMYENRETAGGGPSLVSEELRLQMAGMVAEMGEMRMKLVALEQMRIG